MHCSAVASLFFFLSPYVGKGMPNGVQTKRRAGLMPVWGSKLPEVDPVRKGHLTLQMVEKCKSGREGMGSALM